MPFDKRYCPQQKGDALFTERIGVRWQKNLVRGSLQHVRRSLEDSLWTKCCPVIFCLTFVLIGASALYAITDVWQGPTNPPAATSWFIDNNWFGFGSGDVISHFPPTINDAALVTNGNTARVAGPGAEAATLDIGPGTVQIMPNGVLTIGTGGTGIVVIGPGGTLRFSGGAAPAVSAVSSGQIAFTNNGIIVLDGSFDHSLSGLAGSGRLIMEGTGTLAISGNNTYSGGTISTAVLLP